MSARILVVDDEPDLLELVRFNLTQAGFQVTTATSGREGLEQLKNAAPDLVVLDLMLPDVSGNDICRQIRSDPSLAELPILMLTAKSEEVDRVVGFELGADDYVAKPFSPRELTLRVRAVLRRRAGPPAAGSIIEHGALRVDPDRHRCFVEGEEIELTAKEFRLLSTLMAKPGRVMTRERLLDEVWGSEITVTSRTIDTHLKRLREKLGPAGDLIETVRGVGYRFAE
ncbi:Phosphate regulon transcriptional regulatory protein PhoB [Myxococcaceae bacterium]|jgi:two-component system phosphate regulon response regulator PhoB|nr:Phosphate regulon transcriptional regulatory protein PhoB [Myxococcaceae bacterium]